MTLAQARPDPPILADDVARMTDEDRIMRQFARLAVDLKEHQRRTETLFAAYDKARLEAEAIGIETHVRLAEFLQVSLSTFRRHAEDVELQARAKEIVAGDNQALEQGDHGWPERQTA